MDLTNKKAPQFCIQDANEEKTCLKNYLGKWVILYFYPKDNTPGCTIEAIDFTVLKKDFEKKNAVVIGISKDTCESHRKFVDKKKLTIKLLSDTDSKVQEKYGVWKEKKFMGRTYIGTVRTTFLINPKGKIVKVWSKVKVKNHAKDVLESIVE